MEINKDVIEYAKIVDELYNTYATDISKFTEELKALSEQTGSQGALNKLVELLSKAVNTSDNLFERREALFLLASYSIAAILRTDEEIKLDIAKEKEGFERYVAALVADYSEDNYD